MKPTGRMRWVREEVAAPQFGIDARLFGYKLQMEVMEVDKWEWRDVPLVDGDGKELKASVVMVPWKTG